MVAGTPGPARPILELHFPRSISGTLTLTRDGLGAWHTASWSQRLGFTPLRDPRCRLQ